MRRTIVMFGFWRRETEVCCKVMYSKSNVKVGSVWEIGVYVSIASCCFVQRRGKLFK